MPNAGVPWLARVATAHAVSDDDNRATSGRQIASVRDPSRPQGQDGMSGSLSPALPEVSHTQLREGRQIRPGDQARFARMNRHHLAEAEPVSDWPDNRRDAASKSGWDATSSKASSSRPKPEDRELPVAQQSLLG